MSRRPPVLPLLAVLLAPAGAWAMEPAESSKEAGEAQTVEGVIITADQPKGFAPGANRVAKLAADPRDIPQSITVIDKTLLQAQGATSLADALHNVPGITLGGAEGGQIGNNINLNGFTARTDIYLDSMRDRGQYYRDTFALDEVEVLMGPSSMLFGRGSTGGVIDQVSKAPSLKPALEMSGSVGSNGLARTTFDADGKVADGTAARIALMAQDGAPGTRRDTTVKDFGAAPSVKFGIGSPTEVTVSALLQHNHDTPDYGVSPLNGHPVPLDKTYGFSDDRTIQQVAALGATVVHKLSSAVSVRNQTQFNLVDVDARETASNTVGLIGAGGFSALAAPAASSLPLDDLAVRLQSHDRKIRDWSLYNDTELTAAFATGPFHHDLLLGAEFGHDDYRNQGFYRNGSCNGVALNAPGAVTGYVGCESLTAPTFAGSPANAPSRRGNLALGLADSKAVYASDTIQLAPQLKLVAGLRFDDYAATISNSINASNTPGNTTLAAAKQTVDFTSVRTGAIWQPDKMQSYYVSYSTSFDPSLEQLTSTTGISQPLPPETNRAYELGGKWELPHGLEASAAAFQITQYNARSQNSDNSYTADGTVRVRGARLGVSGRLTKRWQIFAGYTYLDGRIVQAVAAGTLGRVPANTPRQSAVLWSTYEIAPHWEIGGGATHMSSRFANNTDLTEVGGYTRMDATVAWRHARWDLRLNLFNLTDARYDDALIQSDGGRAVPGSGRTALLTLTVRP